MSKSTIIVVVSFILCVAVVSGCSEKEYIGFPLPAPKISDIRPNSIQYGSAVQIRINGNNFLVPIAVSFGNVSATDVYFDSSESVVATTSILEPGIHDVTITIPNFESVTLPGALSVVLPQAPDITTAVPDRGVESGGDSVSIVGNGFYGGAIVYFGDTAAASATVDNDSHITAVTPAHTPGVVSITVTNVDGQQDILVSGFEFYYPNQPPVTVTGIPADPSSRIADLGFTLSDGDNSTADISVQFSVDGGNSWTTASEWTGSGPTSSGTSGLASGGGTSHTFRWNTFADLGKTPTTARMQITPYDGISYGNPVETADFTYVAPPVLQSVSYFDWTGDGDVSEEDELLLVFDEAVRIRDGSVSTLVLPLGTEFDLPITADTVGMNAFLYDPVPGDAEISLYLGGGTKLTPDGAFDGGNLSPGSPSGIGLNYDLGESITGMLIGNAMSLAPVDIQGETTIAPHLAVLALPGLKISCNASGIYVVTETDFTANGVSTGFPSMNLRMFYRGKEVPIQIFDGGDGIWDSGDSLIFYSRGFEDYYTDRETYFLVVDSSTPGLRVSAAGGVPTGTASPQTDFVRSVRYEDNFNYVGNVPIWDGDPWVGDIVWNLPLIVRPNPPVYSIDLPGLSGPTGNAVIMVGLQGGDDGENFIPHSAEVGVNGTSRLSISGPLDCIWFSGMNFTNPFGWESYESCIAQAEFPQSSLNPTSNTISVTSLITFPPDFDVFYVNFFEIFYNSTYVAGNDRLDFYCDYSGDTAVSGFAAGDINCWQITNPDSPKRIVGGVLDGLGTYTFYQSGSNDYIAWSLAATPEPDLIEPIAYEDLHATATQADYIMITHPDFTVAAATLKTHRESADGGSHTVKLIDVNSIYNEFEFGRIGPRAIRNFLNYAYYNWQAPRPEFVLLVGDAIEDPKRLNRRAVAETGDTSGAGDASTYPYRHQLYYWHIVGEVKGINTDPAGKLHVDLSDSGGNRTVSLYMDAAKTLKVAEGSLVGDGTVILNEQGSSSLSGSVIVEYLVDDFNIELTLPFIETYIPAAKVITRNSNAPCDFPYADITGTDYKPDYYVGRLPVSHIDNADTIVSKTISYELAADTGTWERKFLHVSAMADSVGNFPGNNSLLIANYNGPPYSAQHLWSGIGNENEATPATILSALNNCASIVTFLGHGTHEQWYSKPNTALLFDTADIPSLANGDNSFIILAFNCINGYFTGAEGFALNKESMAERFVEHSGSGAVACWACSGLNTFPEQYVLADRFHYGYFVDSERVLGMLTRNALEYLIDQGVTWKSYGIINTYVILGDPALKIK
ncbi:MAG: C25 family cysteine peptidase [Planctomycetota bacterium]|jgi:hypothetical protein